MLTSIRDAVTARTGKCIKMVTTRDYKIELVYADTKKPFIEHTKDEKSTLKLSPASSTLSVSSRLGLTEDCYLKPQCG
jgi:hypothetical protein